MTPQIEIRGLVLALDLVGTAVFALSGAAVGVKHRLDVFGVGVLAFVAGKTGGMLREDLYAVAALCIGIRLVAIRRGWSLPTSFDRRGDP